MPKYVVNIFDTKGHQDLFLKVEAASPKAAAREAIAQVDITNDFAGDDEGTWEFTVFVELE